jgi:hypothetical protein
MLTLKKSAPENAYLSCGRSIESLLSNGKISLRDKKDDALDVGNLSELRELTFPAWITITELGSFGVYCAMSATALLDC